MCSVSEPPTYVSFHTVGSHKAIMLWELPRTLEDINEDYATEWSINGDKQQVVVFNYVNQYEFTDLMPSQTFSAAICGVSGINLFRGHLSERKQVVLPDETKG